MKKTVKMSENDLVELIDKIVNEAVEEKKQIWLESEKKKWITENKAKSEAIIAETLKRVKESAVKK